MSKSGIDFCVIGGGAAGVFSAIQAVEHNPKLSVIILEAGGQALSKVLISGGGRCNVTHHEFDPEKLVEAYPRGQRELRGPFSRFQPSDMLEWLSKNGVQTKTEEDGRMFPVSDSSQTIVDLFLSKIKKLGITLKLNTKAERLFFENGCFHIHLKGGGAIGSKKVLIATGGGQSLQKQIKVLGHHMTPSAPSLFTFKVKDPRLQNMQGISFEKSEATLVFNKKKVQQQGGLLITHWGLSGPVILKLSSWAAREFQECGYKAMLNIRFLPQWSPSQGPSILKEHLQKNNSKIIRNAIVGGIPRRYWENLLHYLGIDDQKRCDQISKADQSQLVKELTAAEFQVEGKGIFKEEFVTCGGVKLGEVNFKTMESKIVPNLFFAGEVLDVDGLTGGYNFQNAWTTGYLAGKAVAEA